MGNVVSRRLFLKLTSGLAAGAGAAAVPGAVQAAPAQDAGRAGLPYTAKAIGRAGGMKVNAPVNFTYPDASSPCIAVRMGTPVPGGVGPNGDIVAFSQMCTHMGCPVAYDAEQRVFKCGCHFSMFDAEQSGQIVCGQATESLPRIVLNYNSKDDSVTAVAIDGLLYGRQSNLL
jgi:arsenite oxidase small subunit